MVQVIFTPGIISMTDVDMARWKTIVFLIGIVASSGTDALDSPSDVSIFGVSRNSIFVNFTRSPDAVSCEIQAQAKFLYTDTQKVNSTDTEIRVSGLQSNVRYAVIVRCFASNGTASAYATPVEARTYPNGSSVVASHPFPHTFTVFLDQIPGAKQWILEVVDVNATAPTIYILESPYKIFNDANPDTTYKLRARISRIKSKDLTEAKSPYGESISITTAKLSVFGRVVLLTQMYDANLTNKFSVMFGTISTKWEDALLKEYSGSQPKTTRVNILEFENNAAIGTMLHHEIFVSGTSLPNVTSFFLNNRTLYDSLKVTADVYTAYQYSIYVLEIGNWELSFDVEEKKCDGSSDNRKFSLNRYDGWTQFEDFTDVEVSAKTIDYLSSVTLMDNVLQAGGRSVQLHSNSMYSIDQSYLFKMCEHMDDTSFLYSRRHGAFDPFTTPGYNETILHSTGPAEPPTDGITYRVSGDLTEITITMPPIYRANNYNFSIDGIQAIQLHNLDSSSSVEARFSRISPLQEYCIMIFVTINHPDWRQETSSPSCFPFYSGSPNSTSCRVVEVTAEKFRVTFEEVRFSTSYIVEITNATYARNYTTKTNDYIADHLMPRAIYNVRVATQNPFGIGMFSETKSTKFWTFSEITNSSFKLAWDNETADLYYDVGIAQENRIIRVNTNAVVITGLEAGATYDSNITVIIDNGALFLFTDQQITVPANPSLRLQSKNAHSLLVAWDSTAGVDYYWANITGREAESSFMNQSSASLISFTDLLSGTRYSIRVSFHNAGGSSETVADFVTDFQIPSGLAVKSATNDSLILAWDEIKGATSFLVSVRALNDDSSSFNVTTTAASVDLIDLSPGTNFSINIIAEYDEGESEPSETFYQVTVPATPTNLTLLSNSKDSITISWLPVYGVDVYTVIVEGFGIQNTSLTSSVVEKLFPNLGYNVKIIAHNSAGKSAGIAKRFFTEFLVPGIVTGSEIKSDSFLLKWKGNKDALRFEIFLRTSTDTVITETNTTSSMITSLKPYTNYSASVRAFYAEGQSDSSELVNIITDAAFKVEWVAVSGANRYFVNVSGQDEINTTLTQASFFNVESSTKYLIQVRGYNDAGFGNYAQIDFETAPSPPTVILIDNNETSVTLSWNKTKGAQEYFVFVTTLSGVVVLGLSGTGITFETSVTIGGLESNFGYHIKVSAGSTAGNSTYSRPIALEAAPAPPRNMTLTSRTSVALQISWKVVANVTAYDVTVNEYATVVTRNFAQILSLKAGTIYTVIVRSVSSSGRKSRSVSADYQTLPDSPLTTVANSLQTSLDVKWDSQKGAQGYNVWIILQSTGSVLKNITTHLNATSFANLTAGTKYTVNATSTVEGEHSSPPSTIDVITLCQPPSGVVVTLVTQNSVSMHWIPLQGADSYDIVVTSNFRRRRSAEGDPKITINSTTGTVENLSAGSRYSLNVAAVNLAGRSTSGTIAVKTGISNPMELLLVDAATKSVTLQWNGQSGVSDYRLITTMAGQQNETSKLVGLVDRATVEKLSTGSSYQFSIRTLSETQPGSIIFENKDFAPSVTVITVPLSPSDLKVRQSEDQLLAVWKMTNGAVLYFVHVETESTSTILNTTNLNATIPLASHIRFSFTVTAMNAQNRVSAKSSPVQFSVDNNTTGGRTGIPWWIFLVISAVILMIIVSLIVWWKLRKSQETGQGYYNVKYPDRHANDDEVATDYINMENLENSDGYLGPQEPEPTDERQQEREIKADLPEQRQVEEQQDQAYHEYDSGLPSLANVIDDDREIGKEDTAENSKLPDSELTLKQQTDKRVECENGNVGGTDAMSSGETDVGTEKSKDDKGEDSPVYARIRKIKVLDESGSTPHQVTQDDGNTVDKHEESDALDNILA